MPLLPPVREFRQRGMHRLIPARYNETGTVLEEVAEDDAALRDAALLDAATNERIHGESYGLSGISQFELVYGIPNAQIIRAAFLHPGPFGARFNDTTRGAWYAARRVETSIAEVAYHKARRLMEIVAPAMPGGRPDEEVSSYDDWQADLQASFHALDPAEEYAECLEPEPVPECYLPSQRLARQLLGEQSNGVLYPSVRHPGGACLACFRPALVYRPRPGQRYEIHLQASRDGYKRTVRVVAA
ncbi:MAG TPA: RES family NAD+ phosphorylase [Acidobacteriaceae bacterium]|nr:RES family NAD+ phosphorylase [Acidobacteriaceae bacterium]